MPPECRVIFPPKPVQPKQPDRFIKHANLMSMLTMLSRVFGMIRDKTWAIFIPQTSPEMGAFAMGFQWANLFRRIFGEGALTAIFVPTYTRILKENGKAAADRLASATCSLLVIILGSLTVIGECITIPIALNSNVTFLNRLACAMIAIQLPYCVMVCLVAIMSAIATVHEKFRAQSLSPIILNVMTTVGAAVPVWIFTSGYPLHKRVFWVAGSVLAAGVLQIWQMLPTLKSADVHLRLLVSAKVDGIGEIAKAMLPMIIGLSAVQVNTALDMQFAWFLSPDGHGSMTDFNLLGWLTIHTPLQSGAAGVLFVAQRLYLLPVGIFGVSMATALFPPLSLAAAKNDKPEIKRLMLSGLRKTLFLSLPMSVGMILIAKPLIALLYSPNVVERAYWASVFYFLGIWAFEAQMVILRVFYALKDTITPMKVAVSVIALSIVSNLCSVWFLHEGSFGFATTVSATTQCAILLVILRNRIGRIGLTSLGKNIAKGLLATAIMSAAGLALIWLLDHLTFFAVKGHAHTWRMILIYLPLMVIVCSITYAASAIALRMPELGDVPVVGRRLRRFVGR